MGQEEGQPSFVGEGAAVLDFDRRIVFWFGGPALYYDLEFRCAFRTLMARNWSGWQERWAEGEINDIHHYLGWQEFFFGATLGYAREPDRSVGSLLEPAELDIIVRELPGILGVLRWELAYPSDSTDTSKRMTLDSRSRREHHRASGMRPTIKAGEAGREGAPRRRWCVGWISVESHPFRRTWRGAYLEELEREFLGAPQPEG